MQYLKFHLDEERIKSTFYGLYRCLYYIYSILAELQEAFKITNFTKRSNNFYTKLRGDEISGISNSTGNKKYCLR